MDGLGYACALALAAVFVRAGAAKVARHDRTAASFTTLGVPAASATARAVPAVELMVAAVLLALPRAGAVAALALLLAFTAVLVRAVRNRSAVPCNCFGTARSDPVSPFDIVRNLMLAGLAVVAGSATTPVVPDVFALVATGAAAGCGLLVLAALRRRTAGTPG